jgi:hypothetical protein
MPSGRTLVAIFRLTQREGGNKLLGVRAGELVVRLHNIRVMRGALDAEH